VLRIAAMIDRGIAVLAAALSVQAFFSWRSPPGPPVWRDDLDAELALGQAALRTSACADGADQIISAACGTLRVRLVRAAEQLKTFDSAAWLRKAVMNTTAFEGHTAWIKQWRADWQAELRQSPSVAVLDASDSCPSGSPPGSCAAPPPTAAAPARAAGSHGAGARAAAASGVAEQEKSAVKRESTLEQKLSGEQAAPIIDDKLESAALQPVVSEALKMMKAEPTNTKIQEKGCEMLRYLATDEASRNAITSMKGTNAILKAMHANPDAPDVQGYCCGTLAHLAASPVLRKTELLSHKGVRLVLKAMSKHIGSPFVQYKGCAMLANFASTGEEQAAIGALGGTRIVLDAISIQSRSKEVLGHCLGTLYNLAAHSLNFGNITSMGGVLKVQKALGNHLGDGDLQTLGKKVLGRIDKNFTSE